MNPWLVLGPLGMVGVGLGSMVAGRRILAGVGWPPYFWGGLIWLAAILPKVAMEFTLTPILNEWWSGSLALLGAYVGLRTGLLENGLAWLALAKTRLKGYGFREAGAFGVGFGAFEAILLGLPAALQVAVFTANPALLEQLPAAERELMRVSLSLPTWVVGAPIIERAFTLLVHIASTLLVYWSIIMKRLWPFLAAVAYKSVVDAAVPYLQATLNPQLSPTGAYLAEVWVVAMGMVGFLVLYRLWSNLKKNQLA